MSSTPREIGTLIVVVLKANHLPNKRQFGKQDPYCVVEVNGEKRRTKAIKRGGQHPEWDEEIRFVIYEDLDDELARTANGDGTPPPLPPKNSHAPKKIQGGKTMQLMCFADDPREPDLIGEGQVDLTEVLTKGETDEWFTLMHKGKFAGKVYLELTFWSNEPPPEKKTKKVAKNGLYGGTGDFTAGVELPESTGHRSHQGRAASLYEQPRRGESISTPSMRSSSSMHQMELYRPSYEQRNSPNVFDQLSHDFAQLNTFHDRRRDSFPPVRDGMSTVPSHVNVGSGYEQVVPNATGGYGQNNGQSPHRHRNSFSTQPNQPPACDPQGNAVFSQPTGRGPRFSIPTSSSGFVPLPSASGMSSRPSEPSGFSFVQPQYTSQGFHPIPTSTPVSFGGSAPASASFHSQPSFPPSQSYQYTPYPPPPLPVSQGQLPGSQASSSPPHSYRGYVSPSSGHDMGASVPNSVSAHMVHSSRPLPPPQQPPPLHTQSTVVPSTSDQHYPLYPSVSPGHDIASVPPSSTSLTSSIGPASRPLPPPQPPSQIQPVKPPLPSPYPDYVSASPGREVTPPSGTSHSRPLPPQPPVYGGPPAPAPVPYQMNSVPSQPQIAQNSVAFPSGNLLGNPPPPPPPLPTPPSAGLQQPSIIAQMSGTPQADRIRRRSSLPVPPSVYPPPQPVYQPQLAQSTEYGAPQPVDYQSVLPPPMPPRPSQMHNTESVYPGPPPPLHGQWPVEQHASGYLQDRW